MTATKEKKETRTNITAREYKDALKKRRVFIVGSKYTRNGWTEYQVYILKSKNDRQYGDAGPYLKKVQCECGYSLEREYHWVYKCVGWGTSRTLEITLAIGYALGLTFQEIGQNAEMLN